MKLLARAKHLGLQKKWQWYNFTKASQVWHECSKGFIIPQKFGRGDILGFDSGLTVSSEIPGWFAQIYLLLNAYNKVAFILWLVKMSQQHKYHVFLTKLYIFSISPRCECVITCSFLSSYWKEVEITVLKANE